MGARGPKKGWKQQQDTAAPVAVAENQQPAAPVAVLLSAADRENPDKLSGEMLRALAHRRGLARSAVERMTDEKIRSELRYLTYRQYEAA